MDEQTLRVKDDFTKGPIVGPLIRFSLPLMLSLLLQALYGGVDLAVVGLYAREEGAAAAVATGSQIMLAATVVITGLTMGVTVLVGKAVGAGDKGQRRRYRCRSDKTFFTRRCASHGAYDLICTDGN